MTDETPKTPPKIHPAVTATNIAVQGISGFMRGLGVGGGGLDHIGGGLDHLPHTNAPERHNVGDAVADVDFDDFGKVDGEREVEDAQKEVRRTDAEKDIVGAIRVLDKSFQSLATYVNEGFNKIGKTFDTHAEAVTKISKGNQQIVKMYEGLSDRLKVLEIQSNLGSKKNANDDIEKSNLKRQLAALELQIKNGGQGESGSGWNTAAQTYGGYKTAQA